MDTNKLSISPEPQQLPVAQAQGLGSEKGREHHPDHLSLLLPVLSSGGRSSKVGVGVEMCHPVWESNIAPSPTSSSLEALTRTSKVFS